MAEIPGMSPKAVDITASFNRGVAMQDTFKEQQTDLEHPSVWRTVYEAIPFTDGKQDRMDKIEALKNARLLIQQIQEKIANAIKEQWSHN